MGVDGGGTYRYARALARAVALAAALTLGLPAAAGATGPAPVPSSTCFSYGYSCTLDGYDAATMGDNWAAKYYGPAALGDLGEPPHNCTLYAAWMLARRGVPDPGHTWGNAWQWGYALARDVNHDPTVGSIAWYGPGRMPNASGHVAYVARVDRRAGLVFLVSDNFGDGRPGATSSGWTPVGAPSGYIHLRVAAPRRHRRPAPTMSAADPEPPAPIVTPAPTPARLPTQAPLVP